MTVGGSVEVLDHLVPAGEVGPVLRHRMTPEPGPVPGCDQVETVVVGVPVSPGPVGCFETVEFQPGLDQGVHGSHTGGPGTNHAISRGGFFSRGSHIRKIKQQKQSW